MAGAGVAADGGGDVADSAYRGAVSKDSDRPDRADGGAGASGPGSRPGPDWGSVLRNALLIAVLVAMIWLAFNVRVPPAAVLQRQLDALGWAGWLVFIALYAVVALTPIPVSVMAVTAGVLFGVLEGSVLSVIGVLLGSWGAYWLARALGRDTVTTLLGRHAHTVEQRLGNAGFEAVFMLRILPGLPYWPVNYGSGAFGIAHRDYVVASVLAVIPGQVSLVAVGAFVAEPSVAGGVGVAIAWLVVLAITIWSYRRWKLAERTVGERGATGEDRNGH